LVTWCLAHRKTVIIVTLAAFVVAIGLFKFVPKQFFPASSRPELMVDLWLPQAATFAETEKQVKALEAKLKGDPNIVNITSYVGSGSPRYYMPLDQQFPNLNFGQLTVMTRDEHVREQVVAKIQNLFEHDFPSVRGRVTRLENGPPVGYPIQFRVAGPDEAKLRPIADKVAAIMRSSPYTRQVNTDWSERVKVVRLEIDQDKARALGMTSQQLAYAMQTSLTGITITDFREANRNIDVVGRLTAPERTDLNNLKDAKIYLHDGRFVPLSQIARLKLESEESLVWRRNRMPTISVRADVEGAQAPDVTMALWPEVKKLADALPLGYTIEIGGTQESSVKSQDSITAVMPLMLFTVMTLLMFQLQSISKMVLVLLTAPLGMIGVSAMLFTFQVPFGFVAQLGVIALAGMIMRNSVILVDQIDHDVAAGASLWDAIIESAVRRFRPIMLTAAAAILAMVPLTRSTFWGPMAWAIMGGLLVATLLTLLFLPALYAAWYRVKKPFGAG
jgi:multidrug efflux pump